MKKARKLISSLILTLFLFSMIAESSVLAAVIDQQTDQETSTEVVENTESIIETASVVPRIIITSETKEAMRDEQIFFTGNIEGISGTVYSAEVTYSLASDRSKRINVNMFYGTEGLYGDVYASSHHYSGVYEVEYVDIMSSDGPFRSYNEKLFPEEEIKQTFPDSSFSISGTYGGVIPEFSVSVNKKTVISGDVLTIEVDADTSMFHHPFETVQLEYYANYRRRIYELPLGENGKYSIAIPIESYFTSGEFTLEQIRFISTERQVHIYDENVLPGEMTKDLSGGSFTVSDTVADVTAPELISVSFSEEIVTPLKPGIITVTAEDDLSGVMKGSMEFESEKGGYVHIELEKEGDLLVGRFSSGDYFDSSLYRLKTIRLQDQMYNESYYDVNTQVIDFNNYVFDVQDVISSLPEFKIELSNPEPVAPEELVLNFYNEEANIRYDNVTFVYLHEDDMSQEIPYSLYQYETNQYETNHYRTQELIEAHSKSGAYYLKKIILSYNYESVDIGDDDLSSDSEIKADLSAGNYVVSGTADSLSPVFTLKTDKTSYGPNDWEMKLQLDFLTVFDQPQNVQVQLVNTEDLNWTEDVYFWYDYENDMYTGTIYDVENIKSGSYDVSKITMFYNWNTAVYYNSSYHEQGNMFDFEGPVFEVTGTIAGYEPGITVSSEPKSGTIEDLITVNLSVDNDVREFNSAVLTYRSNDHEYSKVMKRLGSGRFQYNMEIGTYERSGEFELVRVTIRSGNYEVSINDIGTNPYDRYHKDLHSGDFSVFDTKIDETAPVLQEILFPEVIYNGERVSVIVDAIDEESGLKYGFASFRAENGRYESVYLEVKDGNLIGELTPYSPNDEIWYLESVQLTDNMENTSLYHTEKKEYKNENSILITTGRLTFSVKQRYIEKAILNINQKTFGPNEDVEVTLNIDADLIGSNNGYLDYTGPDDEPLRIWIQKMNGNLYTGSITIPYNEREGEYLLNSITVEGNNGNAVIYHGDSSVEGIMDLSSLNFAVEGTGEDTIAPELERVFTGRYSVSTNGTQIFNLVTKDDMSGAESGEIILKNVLTGEKEIIQASDQGDGVLKGAMNYNERTAPGIWIIDTISIEDRAQNRVLYYNSDYTEGEGSPFDFSSAIFEVTHSVYDDVAPGYISSSLEKNVVPLNENFKYTLKFEDNIATKSMIMLLLENERGEEIEIYRHVPLVSEIVMIDNFIRYDEPVGKYTAKAIYVTDKAGNTLLVKEENTEVNMEADRTVTKDLSHLDLEVTEPIVEDTTGYIERISVSPKESDYTQDTVISVVPGLKIADAQRMTLVYQPSYNSEKLLVRLEKGTDGNFTGVIKNIYRHNDMEYMVEMLRIVTPARTIDLYDKRVPGSRTILDLSGGDFLKSASSEEYDIPDLSNLTITPGEYTTDDRVAIDLGIDVSGFENYSYLIEYYVDGSYSGIMTEMNSQKGLHAIGKYDVPGTYTIGSVSIYGPGSFKRIDNKKYNAYDEDAVAFEEEFKVYGTTSDYDGPKFISLSTDKKEVSAGSAVTFTLEAEDVLSGVSFAKVMMENPNSSENSEELFIMLYPTPMGELQGVWNIEEGMEPGNWKVRSVRIRDKSGNESVTYNALSNEFYSFEGKMVKMDEAHFDVITNETIDESYPVLKGLSYEKHNQKDYAVLDVIEEESGLRFVELEYQNENGTFRVYLDIFRHNGKYYGEMNQDPTVKSGSYDLIRVKLLDYAGNSITYFHSTSENQKNTMDMSFGKYQVEKPYYGDLEIREVNINKKDVYPGEDVVLTVTLENPDMELLETVAVFSTADKMHSEYLWMYPVGKGVYEAVLPVHEYAHEDTYYLDSIFLTDEDYNTYYVFNEIMLIYENGQDREIYWDLSDLYYTIHDTTVDSEEPVLNDITFTKKEESSNILSSIMNGLDAMVSGTSNTFNIGDTILVEVDGEDAVSGISHLELSYNVFDKIEYLFIELLETETGKYIGEFTIEPYFAGGDWNINSIHLSDYAGNITRPTRSYRHLGVPGYDKLNFNVINETNDVAAPILSSVAVDLREVTAGEEVVYTVRATDDLSGIDDLFMTVIGSFSKESRELYFTEVSEGTYEASFTTDGLSSDMWCIESIILYDQARNYKLYTNRNYIGDPMAIRKDWSHADVSVSAMSGIKVTENPVKTSYYVNEKIDLTGLEVVLHLDNGTDRILTADEYEVSGFDSSKPVSNQIITVIYGEFTDTFFINIIENTLESIHVKTAPEKLVYVQGETLNLTGLSVSGTYLDGSTANLEITMNQISGFNSTVPVKGQVLTITVDGKTVSFNVDIIAKELTSIKITELPLKTDYVVGQKLDLSGLKVYGFYNDGSTGMLDVTISDISGFDSSKAVSAQEVIVTVDGRTAKFTVNIIEENTMEIRYRTHVQSIGWQDYVSDGEMSGTEGRKLRLEAIEIEVAGNPDLGVRYSTHIEKIGWQDYVSQGNLSGTEGRKLRLEAIKMELTGEDSALYDIYYRVHAEKVGWMDWAKNGNAAGTAGFGYRLEAIEIRLVEKGENPNLPTGESYRSRLGQKDISYRTHVQSVGWQDYVSDGEMSGTEGRRLRLEGIEIKLGDHLPTGSIEYSTHVEKLGWLDPVKDGAMSGTEGRKLRLEAINMILTGEMEEEYDIYYRVHAEKVGWMGWAKNGENAGTAGYAYRLEGIEIRLVEKGGPAPGSTNDHYRMK